MEYRSYCHLIVVLSLPLIPLPSLIFMLLYEAVLRPFKNHLSWFRGLYLDASSIKERDLCIMKLASSLV